MHEGSRECSQQACSRSSVLSWCWCHRGDPSTWQRLLCSYCSTAAWQSAGLIKQAVAFICWGGQHDDSPSTVPECMCGLALHPQARAHGLLPSMAPAAHPGGQGSQAVWSTCTAHVLRLSPCLRPCPCRLFLYRDEEILGVLKD